MIRDFDSDVGKKNKWILVALTPGKEKLTMQLLLLRWKTVSNRSHLPDSRNSPIRKKFPNFCNQKYAVFSKQQPPARFIFQWMTRKDYAGVAEEIPVEDLHVRIIKLRRPSALFIDYQVRRMFGINSLDNNLKFCVEERFLKKVKMHMLGNFWYALKNNKSAMAESAFEKLEAA